MARKPIFLYEIDYYNTDTLAVETLRFSTGGYVTRPTDTPANTEYLDLVVQAGSFSSYMFGNGRTVGNSSAGFGEFVVANDRSLDIYLGYGFDMREFRVLSIAGKRDAYATATPIFTGLIDSVEFSWRDVRFIIRSPLAYLNEQATTKTFLGNNTAPEDYEGGDDLKGQIKPFVYGKVYNISPTLVNNTSLLYAVNFDLDGNPAAVYDIPKVYDGEVELTFHDDLPTIAALVAHSAASGQFCTCKAEGVFILHSEPSYDLTCDVVEKSSSADMTPAQLVKRLVSDRSPVLSSSDFDAASVTALDTSISAVEGIYINDSTTILSCVDQLLTPIGCSLIGTLSGTLALTRLEAPATSVLEIQDDEIIRNNFDMVASGDSGAGVPYWKFLVNHTKNYTIHSESDVAGAAIANHRVDFTKIEYRTSSVEVSSLKTAYLAAGVYEVSSLLTSSTDADTEATRQSVLRGQFRKIWNVPTTLNDIVELGSTITIVTDAYGMENGWDGVIIGYEYDFRLNQVSYQVFG